MECYLVGGAVRDKYLRLPVRERDWVVVGATEDEMLATGFRRMDRSFPVFSHPETGEEYALARTERKTGPGHKGFSIHASPDVTLQEDLKRRDLTINAMAESGDGTLIDPFDGRRDLDTGTLRHVSPAFVEDPLRALRVARFCARLAHWGFRVSHGTHRLLKRMAQEGELVTLSAERVWRETEQALSEKTPSRYFEVLNQCGALAILLPELAGALGAAGGSGHGGPFETASPLCALNEAAKHTADPVVRYASLMAGMAVDAPETGRGGRTSIESVCTRLRVPAPYRELASLVSEHGPSVTSAMGKDALRILDTLEALDAFRRPERLARFLTACEAVAVANASRNGGEGIERLRSAYATARDVNDSHSAVQGLKGKALGEQLRRLRAQAIADRLGRISGG